MWQENESILGFGIEAQGVKIVELKKTAKGIELLRADTIALVADSAQNANLTEAQSISVLLKKFMQINNISAKRAIGVIEPSSTLIRMMRIPFMPKEEMKAILEAEVDQYVKFKLKKKVIDFCLLEEISEEGLKKINVLFAVALQEGVDNYLQLAKEADLELVGIEAATLSVIRALYGINIKYASLEPVILVIINTKNIDLCIIKNNRPRFLHTVDINIKEFITAKEEFIVRLVFSIKLVLNYYSRVIHAQEDVTNIVLVINDPSLEDVDKDLIGKFEGVSFKKADTLGRVIVNNSKFSQESTRGISLSFAHIIGAVLRLEDRNDYPLSLNLIPSEKQKTLKLSRELALYVSGLTVILSVFLIIASIIFVNNKLIKGKIAKLDEQIEQAAPQLERMAKEYSNNIDLEKRAKEAAGIISGVNDHKSISPSDLLAQTMELVPDGLWLTDISLRLKEESLILTGNTLEGENIAEYANSLQSSNYFVKVEPVFSGADTQKEAQPFAIKCSLKK